MPRSFDMGTDYVTSVDQVHRALSDRQYWQARLAASGADEAVLERMEVDADGGIDVITVQVLRADRLPSVVSQFHRGDLAIRREETWTPLREARATAAVAGSIDGAPVALTGEALLAPLPDRTPHSRLDLRATVEVRVPLVGRKLEGLIGNQLIELLTAEQQFTTRWILENETH